MNVSEFQKKHGSNFVSVIANPALQAALFVIDNEKLQTLLALTFEDIKENGAVILADFVGHLRHQNALVTLHERRTFNPTDLPAETYSTDEPETTPVATRKPRKSRA